MATAPSVVTATAERPRTNRVRGVCRYFATPAGCFAGNQCKFLHLAPAAAPADIEHTLSPYDANKLCRYFAQGYCRRGAACWFKHELPAEAVPAKTVDEDDLCCAICFEKPEQYGLLDQCNHPFCKACIRNWRDAQGKSVDVLISQMNKTCPSCRTRSRFIIPSNRFPENAQHKLEIVNNYKASMARVDCKYFVVSREKPFCPYGRDCFYKHERADGTPYVFEEGVDSLMERFKQRQLLRSQPGEPQYEFAETIRNIANSLFEDVLRRVPQAPARRARQAEDDDEPPPLERISGEYNVSDFISDNEDEDEDDNDNDSDRDSDGDDYDFDLVFALQQSLLAFHDSLHHVLAVPRDGAPPAPAHGPQDTPISQQILAIQDSLMQTLGIPTNVPQATSTPAQAPPAAVAPAPAEQEQQEPDISRQYDVFDLD